LEVFELRVDEEEVSDIACGFEPATRCLA